MTLYDVWKKTYRIVNIIMFALIIANTSVAQKFHSDRHQDKAITADIASTSGDFTGKAEASLINSDDLKATFTFDKLSQYLPVIKEVKFTGNKLSYTFPPHSFTQIKIGVKK